MSFAGWSLLFIAVAATVGFVAGLIVGETISLPFLKSKDGPTFVSYATSPTLYLLSMALNLTVACGIWGLFIAWLRSRQS